VLGESKEVLLLTTPAGHLDDGGDELLKKVGDLQEIGPEVVDKVDDQTLNMAPVMVLHGEEEKE
jgi:hypothetical protein